MGVCFVTPSPSRQQSISPVQNGRQAIAGMKARNNCTADVLRPSAIGLFHEVACIDVDMFRFRTHLQFFFLRARVSTGCGMSRFTTYLRFLSRVHACIDVGIRQNDVYPQFPLARARVYRRRGPLLKREVGVFPLARARVYRPMTVNRDRIFP